MRTIISPMVLSLFIPLLLVAALQAEVTRNRGWENALKPPGAPGPQLTLATAGKTDYVILLPARATTQEVKAGEDLAFWLKAMTGAAPPLVRDGEGTNLLGPVVSIGRTQRLAAAGLDNGSVELGDEGYRLAVAGNDLFLVGGRTRGIVNAVYALLEEDLGCRWYTRDSQTIPRVSELTFRPVARHFVPALELRDPYYQDAFDEYWSLHNRTSSPWAAVRDDWGGSPRYAAGFFAHTFSGLVPVAKYFKDHPEYFSEVKGKRDPHQLCPSNPQVVTIATARVVEAAKTGYPLISVSPNDGGGYCECARCRAINAEEGTAAGTLLRFVNAIAGAVAKDYPRVKITTLAYLGTDTLPKKTRPAKNVVIIFCTDYDAWRWPFLPLTETVKTPARLKGWADVGAAIYIWDYTTNFSHYSLPMPNMNVVTQNIRFYLKNHVKGVMLQGAYQGPGSDRGPMRCWVWAKQLWDSSLDTRALIRDFNYGYYGAAAEPLQHYDDLLWKLWEDNHGQFQKEYSSGHEVTYNIRYDPAVPFLGRPFVETASALFKQAQELAGGDEELRRRVALAKVPLLYVKLCRGPGFTQDDYSQLLAEFEGIARREKITFLKEGAPDVQERIQAWRQLAAPARKK